MAKKTLTSQIEKLRYEIEDLQIQLQDAWRSIKELKKFKNNIEKQIKEHETIQEKKENPPIKIKKASRRKSSFGGW